MIVHSYLELTTTVIGWHIATQITKLLVASGLVYIPLGIVLVRNWVSPIRSQESKDSAPVSLRRMEQDTVLIILVFVFLFLPAVPVAPSNILYLDSNMENTVSAGDPNVPFMRDISPPDEIKVPVLWWFVHEISSFATRSVVKIIDGMSDPSVLRPTLMRLARLRITDNELINEIRTFRRDCYEPSLAKYQALENPPKTDDPLQDVDWIGSRLFIETPGFYSKCNDVSRCGTGYHAKDYKSNWASVDKTRSFGAGKPYCDIWWTHSKIGLRNKIFSALESEAPWLHEAIQDVRENGTNNENISVVDYEDHVIRRITTKAPWIMVERADRGKSISWFSKDIFSINGMQQIIASIGALIVSAISSVFMEFVVIGLPMGQAIFLMMFYLSIPLAIPFSVIYPQIIVRFIIIMFSLRFVTALWALAKFLDEKLLETMYPDSSLIEFGGSGTAADLVLNLITIFSYLTLPVLWFLVMSSLGSTSSQYLSSVWSQFNQRMESTTKTGTEMAAKGASLAKSKIS